MMLSSRPVIGQRNFTRQRFRWAINKLQAEAQVRKEDIREVTCNGRGNACKVEPGRKGSGHATGSTASGHGTDAGAFNREYISCTTCSIFANTVTLGWSHGCDLSHSFFCRKSPTNASRSVSVPQARRLAQASKSVWRCAWTATWTHSTSFPRATHRGYKENSRTWCDVVRQPYLIYVSLYFST